VRGFDLYHQTRPVLGEYFLRSFYDGQFVPFDVNLDDGDAGLVLRKDRLA